MLAGGLLAAVGGLLAACLAAFWRPAGGLLGVAGGSLAAGWRPTGAGWRLAGGLVVLACAVLAGLLAAVWWRDQRFLWQLLCLWARTRFMRCIFRPTYIFIYICVLMYNLASWDMSTNVGLLLVTFVLPGFGVSVATTFDHCTCVYVYMCMWTY